MLLVGDADWCLQSDVMPTTHLTTIIPVTPVTHHPPTHPYHHTYRMLIGACNPMAYRIHVSYCRSRCRRTRPLTAIPSHRWSAGGPGRRRSSRHFRSTQGVSTPRRWSCHLTPPAETLAARSPAASLLTWGSQCGRQRLDVSCCCCCPPPPPPLSVTNSRSMWPGAVQPRLSTSDAGVVAPRNAAASA